MSEKKPVCSCNCERVAALEKRVDELAEALAHHLAHKPTLFWQWDEIVSYTRRPKRTLQRYVKEQGFPVSRIGAFVISSPSLIDAWMIARKQRQRERRARRNQSTYMGEYWRIHPRQAEVSAAKPLSNDAA
jgi:hypothetical protein